MVQLTPYNQMCKNCYDHKIISTGIYEDEKKTNDRIMGFQFTWITKKALQWHNIVVKI